MPGWAAGDIQRALQRAEELRSNFLVKHGDAPSEYEIAPRPVQDLLDTCFYFTRVLTDFLRVISRFEDTYPQPISFVRKAEECDLFFATYWRLRTSFFPKVDAGSVSSIGLFKQSWHEIWSQTGQNPRDLIDRLKVEIRLFSTYILLSALKRNVPAHDTFHPPTLKDPGVHTRRKPTHVRWQTNVPDIVLEDTEDPIHPLELDFDEVYAELISVRYMYERETNMNSLYPSRNQNFAIIEHKLLRAWHILCVRAGLAEVAGATPALPRDSRELLEAPNRNFNEIIVSLAEPSLHGNFRPAAFSREFSDGASPILPRPPAGFSQHQTTSGHRTPDAQLPSGSEESKNMRNSHDMGYFGPSSPPRHQQVQRPQSVTRSPELAITRPYSDYENVGPLTRTYSDQEHLAPMGRSYSDQGRVAQSPVHSPTINYARPSPSDPRATSQSSRSITPHTSPFQPGSRGSTNLTNLSLPSSNFFLASIILSSRLRPLYLVKWNLVYCQDGSRYFEWDVLHSSEKLRHYMPSRDHVMPHVPHESMSNASTVAFFQRHVVEYMAQDYQFNQEVTARYTFQDEIAVARDGFLESVRDKRLVDSFSFDLMWSNKHKRVANYGMPRGFTNNERLNIWEDLQHPHRYTLTFFVADDYVELALRDIREVPREDSHHVVSIELGPRDLSNESSGGESVSKLASLLPRRKNSKDVGSTTPLLNSPHSTDPHNLLAGVATLHIQFTNRSSARPAASGHPLSPSTSRRRSSVSSRGSGERSTNSSVVQESRRFIDAFKVAYQNDLVEHPVPLPVGYVEAPYDNIAPVELPAEREPVELPAEPVRPSRSGTSAGKSNRFGLGGFRRKSGT